MKSSKYNFYLKNNNNSYIYNSLSNSLIEVENDLSLAIKNNNINKLEKEELKLLQELLIVSDNADEENVLNSLRLKNLITRFDDNILNLTIAPTSSCNFDCTYCYEDDRPNVFMNKNTELKLIEFIEKHKNVKKIYITWFGGEPLLNFKFIKRFVNIINEKGYILTNSFITNGYLLNKKTLDWLAQNRISYLQITIDGFENTHNLRRPHINNKGSYKRIIDNLDNLFKSDVNYKVILRINIDSSNEQEYPDLANYLTERYKDKNLFLSPSFVASLDSNQCNNNCLFVREDKALFKLNNISSKGISLYPTLKSGDCIARQKNGYVIGVNGELYKCYEDIGKKEKEIGNIFEKEINEPLLTEYLIGADQLFDKECIDCKLLPICNGGCPYVRINNNKTGSSNNENCVIFKDFEKEFILAHIKTKKTDK